MNVFVPKGFLTIPETTLRLADPSQSDREVALKEAREPLHQGLGGGSVEFVIQMPTGEHLVPPPDIWRSSNSLNWIVDGKVFVPDGTYPMTLILLKWMAAHGPFSSLSKIVLSVFEAEWRGRKKSKDLVQL